MIAADPGGSLAAPHAGGLFAARPGCLGVESFQVGGESTQPRQAMSMLVYPST